MTEYIGPRPLRYSPKNDGDLLEFIKNNRGPTQAEIMVGMLKHLIAEGHDLTGDVLYEFYKGKGML